MPRRCSGGRLHEGPRAVHSVVKRLPRLAVGRCVAGLEHIEAELSIGRAPEVSEVALLEERAVADGSAGDTVKVIGGRDRARVVAREDEDDALVLESAGESRRLQTAARGERIVGELDGARGVAQRLAVAD